MTPPRKHRVAIYVRVSTSDQTTEHQRRELVEWAERAGHDVVGIYADEGISGAKDRSQRPAFDEVMRLVAQRKVTMVAAWSVDRLGRSLLNLVETLGELRAAGADLFLHQQGLDTTTSAGRAMYQMLGVFAEFEREMIRERVRAGMATAKAAGKPIGRPRASAATITRVRELRALGKGLRTVAREVGCGVSLVQRIDAESVEARGASSRD